MSRIGKKPIAIPAGVEVKVEGRVVTAKGPNATLSYTMPEIITAEVKGAELIVSRPNDEQLSKTLHGTTRANLQNVVSGAHENFKKNLEIVGVGYHAELKGNTLVIYGGYSHTVDMPIPEGLKVTVPEPVKITIEGADKQLVGEFAAEVRQVRKPEPYKGKGIHYVGEYIRRKEGKKAK